MTRLGILAALTAVAALGLGGASAAKSPAGKASTCGQYGTSIMFEDSPADAARQAKADEKLVMVLHISGYFEDPRFTWNNAEALRVSALASPEVGRFVTENFCASFQKVGTFKIVGGAKQGGNVATYFCAPDGRVLHAVAGPVDAGTFLREAQWVVETTRKAIKHANGDGGRFKAYFRQAHAQKLRDEFGLAVEPVTFDPPDVQAENDALTFRDPSGQPLAPRLPPPPIDGPDVRLDRDELKFRQGNAAKAPGAVEVIDRRGGRWVLPNQGKVHQIMAGHAMIKIERVYGTVFENILGEKISTKPVEVDRPFSWMNKDGQRLSAIKLLAE